MPSGTPIDEALTNYVLDMNAQPDSEGRPRFSFREIAYAAGCNKRTVAMIIREYAGVARRRERADRKLFDLTDPK